MKEFGNKDSEREIARLRKQNGSKSPVKANVLKFEGENANSDVPSPKSRNARREERNARLQNQSLSPTRSISPGMKNERPNQLFSPTGSKSPGMKNERPNQLFRPIRSKSPSVKNERPNQLFSPTRSKSPSIQNERPNQLLSPTGSKSPSIKNERLNQLHSPTGSKSPSVKNERPNQLFSPTGSKSPSIKNERLNQLHSPTGSKSPSIKNERPNQLFSPTGSKSPGMSSERPNEMFSPTRGKSPGSSKSQQNEFSSPTRSKSPGIVTEHITKSSSPSPTTFPSEYSKWIRSDENSWKIERPDPSEKPIEIVPSEPLPKSDDFDISWILDNIEFVTTPEKDQVMLNASAPSEEDEENQERGENGGEEKLVEEKERFRNVLNYNMAAWNKNDSTEDNMPKKADEFIQRLCDQVRNHVEYLCGVNFITYQAVSYKVRVAGAEGIYYYVKVNVWQNCCVHLRIFSHKNELEATPTLQAILERAQSDKGNIEFF